MWRDGFDTIRTMAVMAAAGFLVIAPLVAIVAYEQVGQTVLGILTVLVLFQVLGRIGAWRWAVWDGRERDAARTGNAYPRLRRVAVQVGLLFATLTAFIIGVTLNSDPALIAGLIGAGIAVLLGVSIDVLDAARQDQVTPAGRIMQSLRA